MRHTMSIHSLVLWTLSISAAPLACFRGDTQGLPCADDDACNELRCIDGFCGGPAAPCVSDDQCTSPLTCIAEGCRVPRPGSTDAVAVATSDSHTCAILASGQMRCWGSNAWWQLGQGLPVDARVSAPPAADIDLAEDGLSVVKVAPGGYHENYPEGGYTCALLSNGRVKCWGRGTQADPPGPAGWLGYENLDNIPVPIPPPTSEVARFIPLEGIHMISAGYLYTCATHGAPNTPGGELVCWGDSLFITGPEPIGDGKDEVGSLVFLPSVTASVAVREVVAGPTHVCAIDMTDALWCWGEGVHGEIGVVPPANLTTPASVLTDVVHVSVGRLHTCAVQRPADAVYCWGDNAEAQLGVDLALEQANEPTLADEVQISQGERILDIVSGHKHNCILVATSDGREVRCWGLNHMGQLGLNTDVEPASQPTPHRVKFTTAKGFPVQISAHIGHHTCAVFSEGEVWCWGSNTFGQLGNSGAPPAVTDGTAWKALPLDPP